MSSPYIVNGAATGTYPRLEIKSLKKDEFQFSLFIQAVSKLQSANYSPIAASWQEIGGIHGLPYSRWSGDPKGPDHPDDTESWEGYCYHSSVLFPPWHRVLLMCLEQAVSEEARKIASAISDVSSDEKALWIDAANKLRFPYWDWSDPSIEQGGIPQILTLPTVTIRGPGDKSLVFDNPLMSYRFHPIPEGAQNDSIAGMPVLFEEWKQTYRWATGEGLTTESNVEALNEALQKGVQIEGVNFRSASIISRQLASVFSTPISAEKTLWPTYWDFFSNTRRQSDPPPNADDIAPLEQPHNWMHLTLGGNGHMSFNELAGFDPIFYLHHCNIDRLYALWEYVFPEYWLGEGWFDNDGELKPFVDKDGTWQEKPGGSLTEASELAPFRKTANEYWVTSDVRGLQPGQGRHKYYSYPPEELWVPIFKRSPGKGWGPYQLRMIWKKVVIDVTKPSSLTQRKMYRSALRLRYMFPNLQQLRLLPSPRPPIFKTPYPPSEASEGLEAAIQSLEDATPPGDATPPLGEDVELPDGFRRFVVTGEVPQFKFHGSYHLRLYLDGKHVDDISVLNRLHPANCPNCVARMASGTASVKGVMSLPHEHVVGLLNKHGKNNENTTDDEVVELLKNNLTAHVVTPVGTKLAEAAQGLSRTPMDDSSKEWSDHYPTLSLHSSNVYLATPDHEVLSQEDWAHHGTVLHGEWRYAS